MVCPVFCLEPSYVFPEGHRNILKRDKFFVESPKTYTQKRKTSFSLLLLLFLPDNFAVAVHGVRRDNFNEEV